MTVPQTTLDALTTAAAAAAFVASPALAATGRVKEPASTIWPAVSDSSHGASLFASQATPIAG